MQAVILKAPSHPLNDKPPRVVPVVGLLFPCCPPYISWLVMPFVVDPIYAVILGWLFTNVVKKCLKIINPFLAHGHANSTVSNVVNIVFIQASGFHRLPRPVFCGNGGSVAPRVAMLERGDKPIVSLKTSARTGRTRFKCVWENVRNIAAVALTACYCLAVDETAANDSQPIEHGSDLNMTTPTNTHASTRLRVVVFQSRVSNKSKVAAIAATHAFGHTCGIQPAKNGQAVVFSSDWNPNSTHSDLLNSVYYGNAKYTEYNDRSQAICWSAAGLTGSPATF